MKSFSLFTGATIAAGLLALASSSYAGSFSDTALTPSTNPPAAVGNDLLLAENISGPAVPTPSKPIAPNPAESWTTQAEVELSSDTQHGYIDPSKASYFPVSFSGSGPTGTYAAGTIGSGKHTENTVALANMDFTPGQPFVYVYTFQYIYYNQDGTRHVTTVQTFQGHYSTTK